MSPPTSPSVCSPLPSSGSRLAPVPHLRRYYEGRTTPPGPSRPSPVSLDGAVPLRWMHVRSPGQGIHPSRGRALCGQACHACSHAGGDGRPPRFLGNPCESVPRARDSGGSQRPRHIGRPDAVFRQANGVDIRHGKRFRSCTLAARFLAAYASTPASRPARGKARYRPARYGVGPAGLSPAGFLREVSVRPWWTFSPPRLGLAR
jgi:hypothetical protein